MIILVRLLLHLIQFIKSYAAVFIQQHIVYPFFLRRYRFLGLWTRASFVCQFIYWTANILYISFRVSSLVDAGTRTGTLALINMIPLYSGLHLSFLADMLGISVRVYSRVHGSVGVLVGALALFHTLVSILGHSHHSLDSGPRLYGLMVSKKRLTVLIYLLKQGVGSMMVLLALSLRFLRRPSYELFLRLHQALAGLAMYSLWRHTSNGGLSTRIYRYALVGSLLARSIVQSGLTLFRNVSYHQVSEHASLTRVKDSLLIDIPMVRPWKVRAGQYINIWMPFFSLRSALQSHPFIIVYWTDGKTNHPCTF